jgi:hypothetical protein
MGNNLQLYSHNLSRLIHEYILLVPKANNHSPTTKNKKRNNLGPRSHSLSRLIHEYILLVQVYRRTSTTVIRMVILII